MKKIIYTILTFCIMLLIFFFSSQNGDDSAKTSGFIFSLFPFLKNIENAEFYIRKFAHFSIYFLLGISTYKMFDAYKYRKYKLLLYSIVFCIFYACTDEFHQSFSAGRSPQLFDVFIDACGTSLSNVLSYCFFQRK